MDKKLLLQAVIKFLSGVVLLAVLLFWPAGTFQYPQAKLLMIVLFIPMFLAGLVMMVKDPELLRKRLNMKENESEQKSVILFSGIMFIAAFIAAGLSFRFNWLMLPFPVSIVFSVVFLFAYLLFAEVLRENSYLSRTVEVQEGQKVIDTGLYGIVRHPMYMATVLLFLSMPLILGSVISFVIMLAYFPIITKRIRNEEKVLEEGLPGYKEYKQKVKYRLLPFIW
ncbi:MAG: isoprenylcysteine carboxylmethyltransferase family protein [Erysipelotrichaceae bacterium]|nr:isoprenylcysteine carboxylmethyltransferase family protein [Erysipelotrichaceae bacterium]MBR3168517.1 isoprenylcysteine carboxylmethyltransferase family protein [Erysipelotrichaceae bacterium]